MKVPERIVIDSEICEGKPCIRGTRLSVDFVLELLASRWSFTLIQEEYEVERQDILAVLQYAHKFISEKLLITSGEKLLINVSTDNSITNKKNSTREQIFKELVGCASTPIEEKVTPEMVKNLWKTHPLEINDNLFEGVSPLTEEELKDAKKSVFPNE